MPRKPRRGCAYPGCARLAGEKSVYCDEHKKVMDKQYQRYKRPADSNKNYGRGWKRIRDRYAKAHPLCERCLKAGRISPVEEVHHIIPLSQGGTHRNDNLMSLCQSCHTRIHFEIGDR